MEGGGRDHSSASRPPPGAERTGLDQGSRGSVTSPWDITGVRVRKRGAPWAPAGCGRGGQMVPPSGRSCPRSSRRGVRPARPAGARAGRERGRAVSPHPRGRRAGRAAAPAPQPRASLAQPERRPPGGLSARPVEPGQLPSAVFSNSPPPPPRRFPFRVNTPVVVVKPGSYFLRTPTLPLPSPPKAGSGRVCSAQPAFLWPPGWAPCGRPSLAGLGLRAGAAAKAERAPLHGSSEENSP